MQTGRSSKNTWSFCESIDVDNIETFLVSSQWNMFSVAGPIFCSANEYKIIFTDERCGSIKLKVSRSFPGRSTRSKYVRSSKNYQLTIPLKVMEPWNDRAHFSFPATAHESSPCLNVQRLSISTNWSSTSLKIHSWQVNNFDSYRNPPLK